MFAINKDVYDDRARSVMRLRGLIAHDSSLEATLEHLIDRICEIDGALGGVDSMRFREALSNLIGDGVIILGTPILQNIGPGSGSAAGCTVLRPWNDSNMRRGSELLARASMMLSDATGIGFDLSALSHPSDALVSLNEHLGRVNEVLVGRSKRPVASMATIRDDHADLVSFIRSKRNVDFSHWRLTISVFVSDALILAAEQDQMWALRDKSGYVVSEMRARKVLREIAESAHYCGEPGVLFRDRLEADNATPAWNYVSTAPCAELAMAEGEACHFSYLNLGKLVTDGQLDLDRFEAAASCCTRMLDAATEFTIQGRGDLLKLVSEKRRIGVGITGFADFLIKMRVDYRTPRARELAAEIAENLDYFTKRASVDLAQQRGPFQAIASSRYVDVQWVRRKLHGKKLQVQQSKWDSLVSDILTHGIRNSSTTSMPPSGTSSEIVGVSKSLEPYLTLRDTQGVLHKIFRDLQENPKWGEDALAQDARLLALPYVSLAKDIEPLSHVAIQAAFQSFVDDGISKTINMANACTADEVYDLLFLAFRHGLKGLSVFRDGCLSEREASNAI